MTDKDPIVSAALDELETHLPAIKHGWPDVLSRATHDPPLRRFQAILKPSSRRNRVVLAMGTGLAAAVVAVGVVGPWHGGPSLVERAAAAISPSKDKILHLVMSESDAGTTIRTESWQFGDPLEAIRISRSGPGFNRDSSMKVTTTSTTSDGSIALRGRTVGYCPIDRTLRTVADGLSILAASAPIGALPGSGDPAAQIQAALDSGALHEGSRTRIGAQDVVKLVGRTPGSPDVALDVSYYANAQDLLPVRLEWVSEQSPIAHVIDFTTAERLPTTADNLALLNVATQHPGSPIQPAQEATAPCG